MPDRHAQTPISIRPPKDDRAWLEAYARETGRPVRAIIVEALAEYRTRRQAGQKRINAVCSLCGHAYASWSDAAEQDAHMAEAHGMYFDPRPLGPWRRTAQEQDTGSAT